MTPELQRAEKRIEELRLQNAELSRRLESETRWDLGGDAKADVRAFVLDQGGRGAVRDLSDPDLTERFREALAGVSAHTAWELARLGYVDSAGVLTDAGRVKIRELASGVRM